jgi:6-pyruvoyltetrahydropterin/6-carboxytetrahydropterin synthase
MFRLTREVRFAVNSPPSAADRGGVTNGHAGYPSLRGLGHYFVLDLTVRGDLDPASQYLVNIKQMDAAVRERAIDPMRMAVAAGAAGSVARTVADLHGHLAAGWKDVTLESVRLSLSPFLSLCARSEELPMVRLSHKFEFSASHRLFNRALSEDENCRVFGKCSNPHGHGHNYELQVTLAGEPDRVNGVLVDLPAFERIVATTVIDRFDHKNLNVEVPEFADLIPSVENIARVIYKLLQPRFGDAGVRLAAVTVWETPKTWCEYSE